MTRTQFGVKAPGFWLYPLRLEFYLTLPDGRQLGPADLSKGLSVTGLPPGDYQLSGQFEGFDPFSTHIILRAGDSTAFQPMKGASIAQRKAFRRAQGQDGKPTILYLQRRKRHAAHFWLGHCESAERLAELLSADAFNEIENEAQRDIAPLNEFIMSQGELWFDRDYLEAGFEATCDDIPERFAEYSWAKEWSQHLAFRACGMVAGFDVVENPNSLIMLGGDPEAAANWRLDNPTDIERPGINMSYMGIIEFTYYDGGPAGR